MIKWIKGLFRKEEVVEFIDYNNPLVKWIIENTDITHTEEQILEAEQRRLEEIQRKYEDGIYLKVEELEDYRHKSTQLTLR